MSSVDQLSDGHRAQPLAIRLALPVFALALFLSALLLFAIQPMFTKMVLPSLGGSPGVWSVAMVFFQGMLLAGYFYAHILTRYLDPRLATFLHVLVMLVAFFALPVAMAGGWGDPPSEGTAFWLLGLFAASVGMPFFAIAANGPLLQAWFARTGHPHAGDPYFLYAASNLGSFAALLLYPVVIEPFLALKSQSAAFTIGFVLLAVALAGCAGILFRSMRSTDIGNGTLALGEAPSLARRATWVSLAFVPSALLVAVTAHISTDVAAAPLLWVLPLALFLLTFVLAFREPARLSHGWMLRLQPPLIGAIAVMSAMLGSVNIFILVSVTLATFFVCAMVAHGELFRLRPAAGRLTEFYLWMSVGGVLGGIFSGLLAPHLFPSVEEYPILLVCALLCRPAFRSLSGRAWVPTALVVTGIGLVAALPGILGLLAIPVEATPFYALLLMALAAVMMLNSRRPGLMVGLLAVIFLMLHTYKPDLARTRDIRSFFGVHRIAETENGEFRLLMHGSTLHGAVRIRNPDGSAPAGRPVPLTYYHDSGLMAQVIAKARGQGLLSHVAVVGLGTGSLACQSASGEDWTFYEIDPEVVRIARNPAIFPFMNACAPDAKIVLGDARLTLSESAMSYNLIVLDAFSSDAVPAHLLTREAVAAYARRLAPGGVIVFHISNRHMALADIVAGSAAANGMVAYGRVGPKPFDRSTYISPSSVVAVARDPADFGGLAHDPAWEPVEPVAGRLWTDDFSNVIGSIWRNYVPDSP